MNRLNYTPSVNAGQVIAGIDVQASGISVRLSFALDRATPAPLSEGSQAACEEFADPTPAVQAAVRAAVESNQELLAAFERARSVVQVSQCLLVEQQLATLKGGQSTNGGAA